ncbi:hypothetical protein MBLNU457_3686t1 [Dothideomycetes sp. NU457]
MKLDMEPFTLVEETSNTTLNDKFQELLSGKTADHDIQYVARLRQQYPELTVTAVPMTICNLLGFAASGHASAELVNEPDEPLASWRGWVPALGHGEKGGIGQTIFFAKYHYKWSSQDFVVYTVGGNQYILKEPVGGETAVSPSKVVDSLLAAVGTWQFSDPKIVWVFDGYWQRSKALFKQVEKAEWENVILDPKQKAAVQDVSTKFFDSKDLYDELGVPWKRGIIFHGPPGNGKTISIKALMHTLARRSPPIASLYVKSAVYTYQIRAIFQLARRLAPCMLIFEDIETIVTNSTRSYFFNEVDGLESNDGILMIASTNYLDRLDPGLSKRPSRFDRKYLFPLPNEHERTLYAEFWRRKLEQRGNRVEFPKRLCPAMASITDGFSFAFLQEAFVATLLVIARSEELEAADSGRDDDDLDHFELWRIFKEQVRDLRRDMGSKTQELVVPDTTPAPCPNSYVDHSSNTKEHRVPRMLLPHQTHPVLQDLPHRLINTGIDAMYDIDAFGPVGSKDAIINTTAFEYQ